MKNKMENFFVEDTFHMDLDSLIVEYEFDDEETLKELNDDWTLKVGMTELEPVLKFSEKYIDELIESIYDWEVERFPEEPENIIKKIKSALMQSLDLEKLIELMPKMYYPNGKFETITKQDVIDYLN